ncbi:hypothetical protein F25303_2143 [Fusarium sp. NRRL 25303]|nr:hypothetical protein F25303_2143 [Fusarium sp. NRRL 25303]
MKVSMPTSLDVLKDHRWETEDGDGTTWGSRGPLKDQIASNLIAQERRQTWGPDLEKSTSNDNFSKIEQSPEAGADKNERLAVSVESLR